MNNYCASATRYGATDYVVFQLKHGDRRVALPARKRQRLDAAERDQRPVASRLFAPYRNIGLVSPTTVPFTSVPLGKTTFQITTSAGRSLQTYDLRRGLQLVFLSRPQCPENITATCAYRDRTFVAWGGGNGTQGGIWVMRRGALAAELETPKTKQQIETVLTFGNWIVGCGPKAIEVWKNGTYQHYTTISSGTSARNPGKSFTGRICTLPTYLNKVFVGRHDGSVAIYNISTAKLVYTINPPSANSGHVTAIHPASAVCVLAIAYADGSLVLVDVDIDEVVMSLQTRNGKPVTSITFRTDGLGAGEDGRKEGVMATASIEDGDITFWDLNRGGKVSGILRTAHEVSSASRTAGITNIEFLAGQNILVSSGLDNALRSWVFDQNPFSAIPRALHARSGHGAPVTGLMFLPAASDGSESSGKWLLSAGHDRSLWGFSLRKDGQNTELSQGAVKHKAKKAGQFLNDNTTVEDFKAPPIIDMACCLNRDGGMGAVSSGVWSNDRKITAEESSMTGWESVVTAHADDKFARTWSWGRKRAGRWTFESGDHKPVTSVAITACGTFALVGSSGGAIDMFNLQSGAQRQRYPPKLKAAQAKELRTRLESDPDLISTVRGHRDSITGLITDNLNQTLVSSSLDGTIIFWDFTSGRILHRLRWPSTSALRMHYNPVSQLIALACDDLCIRILDISSYRIVRELWGCIGQINSLCFSHDGRWIVACSMDSVIRVFDIATSHLIDAFRTATCTNLAFSPTGEYLATTHAGTLGIGIWTNKSLYAPIPTRRVNEGTGIIDLSTSAFSIPPNQLALFEAEDDDEAEHDSKDPSVTTPFQLSSSLLTLSLLPRSRWQTLLNLENIRERNRPIQPPEKPKAAPFFLGSSLSIGSAAQQEQEKIEKETSCRLSTLRPLGATSAADKQISLILRSANPSTDDIDTVVQHLISLPPSATDLFILTLTPSEMPVFITILTAHLKSHRDYELVNTWMAVVLKLHGDSMTDTVEGREAVRQWKDINELESRRLDGMVGFVSGVVGGWLRSGR